jgi:hypothetical protein
MCKHRWRLEEPNGTPTVMAECRLCGETKPMKASGEWSLWSDFANRFGGGR